MQQEIKAIREQLEKLGTKQTINKVIAEWEKIQEIANHALLDAQLIRTPLVRCNMKDDNEDCPRCRHSILHKKDGWCRNLAMGCSRSACC